MKRRLVLLVALFVALLPVAPAGAAEAHPGIGPVFDVREFKDGPDGGGLDDRFAGGPSFPACEIENPATQYAQNLTILATDTCKNHTNGAPGAGIVPMSRTFAASPGESYLSWAYAKVVNPKGRFVARVRLYARNGSGVLRICQAGNASDIGTETADFMRLGTGVCTLPQGTSAVTVEFAAEAKAAGASGRAVLNRIQLLRCASSSPSCPTTVPTTAPPTTAPPPAPTTVAPPVTDTPLPPDGGGGGGAGGSGGVIVDPGTAAPSTTLPEVTFEQPTTTTTRRGDRETLSPIADGRDEKEGGGGNGTFLLVFGLLAVAVAAGTAAGWWAWGRPTSSKR